MKYWAPLLHIYQPPTQDVEVLRRIDEECYKPMFEMLKRNDFTRITLNINGVLIDLLNEYGLQDTVEMLIKLVDKGIVEIVGTAKYHPLLPLIQEKEIVRQIELNEDTNKEIFGKTKQWLKKGFFPPEMAISGKVLEKIKQKGYDWVIASGAACSAEWPFDKIYKTKSNLKVVFRDDVISNEISFEKIGPKQFIEKIINMYDKKSDSYIVTAMDGETFGHHIPNYEKSFLEKAIQFGNKEPNLQCVFISELMNIFPSDDEFIVPKASSWSTLQGDLSFNVPYPLWKHPNNPVHKQQYRMLRALDELINLCDEFQNNENPVFKLKYETARYFYDKGIYSCPMWWASMRPSWDPTLIEKGAHMLLLSALNAQVALINIRISDGDEAFDRFIDYHHKLLGELTKQTANLLNVRTF
ncbi:MAG: hypothetical protein GY870_09435 [archaeon]|nr:hypothetical protein [archaeon]